MKWHSSFALFTISILINCNLVSSEKIVVPKLSEDFYVSALQKVEEELDAKPENRAFNEQRIYYCERLGWPLDCITSLHQLKRLDGMSSQLASFYAEYYAKNSPTKDLITFIDQWDNDFQLKEQYQEHIIKGLVQTGQLKRASNHLHHFLMDNSRSEAIAFGSQQYLNMQDTTMTLFLLSRLQKIDPSHDLMYLLASLLFEARENKRASIAMNYYRRTHSLNQAQAIEIANYYIRAELYSNAIALLKPFCCKQDTTAYLLSTLYSRQNKFDSSIMYLDSLIFNNPEAIKPRWKKAQLYEERGWYSYATQLFAEIVFIDSSRVDAKNRIKVIQRKIAYLQRQKQEQRIAPILELNPSKLKN